MRTISSQRRPCRIVTSVLSLFATAGLVVTAPPAVLAQQAAQSPSTAQVAPLEITDKEWTERPPANRAQVAPLKVAWAPTPRPKKTITPGQMRSDREEIPAGFTKAEADKAETNGSRPG